MKKHIKRGLCSFLAFVLMFTSVQWAEIGTAVRKDLWSAGNAGKPKRGHRCGEYEKFDDVSAGRRKEADRFLWTGCPVRR